MNKYNEIIEDIIIPTLFDYLYKLESKETFTEQEVTLLKFPENPDFYEYHANEELVVTNSSEDISKEQVKRVFTLILTASIQNLKRNCFISISEVVR